MLTNVAINFQILFSSVYVVVVYYLTSQPFEPQRIAMFVFICILTSLVAQSLGLLIGAGLSVEAGVFLGPVSTIPTILFSGFFVNFDTIPGYLQWVTYVSYVRYAFEGKNQSIQLTFKSYDIFDLKLIFQLFRCNVSGVRDGP